jgi:hypothetical protein
VILSQLAANYGTRRVRAVPEVREADSFPRQWDYVTSPERFCVVVCSRRAGKTDGAIRRASRLLLEKPGARVLYVGSIRRTAKQQFFYPLRSYLEGLGAKYTPNEQDLTLRLDSGSFVECASCSDSGDVHRLRGYKWDRVFLDEAQSFPDAVIRQLVDEVIMPSLVDRRGGLDLLGTPPPHGPVGYFYEVFSGGQFERHRWTMFDNPFLPAGEAETLSRARGLSPEHPIYKREYLGEFVVDTESLVYEFAAPRNHRVEADLAPSQEWRYAMGVDLGFSDRDAIVVLGWRRDDPTHALVEVESWQQNHLDVDQLAAVFVEMYRRWKPQSIIGDTGGHGATKVIKSLQGRLGGACEIKTKPPSVLDSIALVNDDLRTGRLRVEPGGAIEHDARLTTWAPGKIKQEVSSAYHSDILDALRYAHWGARHFRGVAPKPAPTFQEEREARWDAEERKDRNPWRRRRAA